MKWVVVIIALLFGTALEAQVGYPPQRSPYRDLAETMEATMYSGYFVARIDPARVAPRSGAMVGALYSWRMGGPANLTADLARVGSERRVLDPERLGTCPTETPECKSLGMYRWPLYMADVGLALSLTGARSWLNLVPQLRTGIGLVTDFHTKPDVGDFAFGTRFAFSWGAGIRWAPRGNRLHVRADLLNRLYSLRYPTTYYEEADDGSTIFDQRQNRTAWLNNPSFTFGLSYTFSR